jgi:cobalt/nickel transport system permease protein
MADALISPVVGGAFWIAGGALIGYSAKKITEEKDNSKTPLMGVLGAFVFAAQMINFSIPGTGSSGHIGGGLLLAALLGPYRAFITLASILTIQCLFFADGGILALGCNIFNLGFFPAFIAYPFIYKPIMGNNKSSVRLAAAGIIAADVGLLMGAFSVVIQTLLSGISELPFSTFLLVMLPVHFAIGIVEGLAVWAVLSFVARAEPSMLVPANTVISPRPVIAVFAVVALAFGGTFAWFASSNPDGLEWSMSKVAGTEEFERAGDKIHDVLGSIQEKLAFLPDYSFKATETSVTGYMQETEKPASPVSPGTSVAGIVGSVLVLIVAGTTGFVLRGRGTKPETSA